MATILENCTGDIFVVETSGGGGGEGLVKLSPKLGPEAGGGRILITGMPLTFAEVVQPTLTLDNRRILYVYGSSWNEVSITGLALLGKNSNNGGVLKVLKNYYNDNRVSAKGGGPVKLSIGGMAVDAYLVGMQFGEANAENNTQPFSLQFVTPDVT